MGSPQSSAPHALPFQRQWSSFAGDSDSTVLHSHTWSGSAVASLRLLHKLPRVGLIEACVCSPKVNKWVSRCAGNARLHLSLRGGVAEARRERLVRVEGKPLHHSPRPRQRQEQLSGTDTCWGSLCDAGRWGHGSGARTKGSSFLHSSFLSV